MRIMRVPPADLDEGALVQALAEGWGVHADSLAHQPVGGGSYHWTASGYWVTADDLRHREFLGDDLESGFQSLSVAFDTARALHDGGLEFVLAPLPTRDGRSVRRLDEKYAVSLFPFLGDATSGTYGQPLPRAAGLALAEALARVHATTPPATVRCLRVTFAHRNELEQALRALDVAWTAGPYAESARVVLASRADAVQRLIGIFDAAVAKLHSEARGQVLTHGEPHPANVLLLPDRLLLIDWDTVALAPPERDLWMLDERALQHYVACSARAPDRATLRLFKWRWLLDDIAWIVTELHAPHCHNAHTERAWRALDSLLAEAVVCGR